LLVDLENGKLTYGLLRAETTLHEAATRMTGSGLDSGAAGFLILVIGGSGWGDPKVDLLFREMEWWRYSGTVEVCIGWRRLGCASKWPRRSLALTNQLLCPITEEATETYRKHKQHSNDYANGDPSDDTSG